MQSFTTRFRIPLTSETADERFGELACFAAALGVLVLGFVGLGRFAGTLAEVFLGTLATLGVSLQLVILGTLVHLRHRLSGRRPDSE